jgi:hypothetical protein
MLFELGENGRYTASPIPSKGGWGSIVLPNITNDGREELISADNSDGTITIYFPN